MSTATGTANPVVFPPQRDYSPSSLLDPAEVSAIHRMLAPLTAVMNANGMTAGGLTVTAGPHGLDVSPDPDSVDDRRGQAKLEFAAEVLRGTLTAAGTLWQAPASTLLCLLEPVPGCPGTYHGLAVPLFDRWTGAHVEAPPSPAPASKTAATTAPPRPRRRRGGRAQAHAHPPRAPGVAVTHAGRRRGATPGFQLIVRGFTAE